MLLRRSIVCVCTASAILWAQAAQPQRTLDVPYVPTTDEAVGAMLKLADVKASDIVYDLGCAMAASSSPPPRLRSARRRNRHQSRADCRSQSQRPKGRRGEPGAFRGERSLQGRHSPSQRGDAVPAVQREPQAPPQVAGGSETRDTHRVEHFRHGDWKPTRRPRGNADGKLPEPQVDHWAGRRKGSDMSISRRSIGGRVRVHHHQTRPGPRRRQGTAEGRHGGLRRPRNPGRGRPAHRK